MGYGWITGKLGPRSFFSFFFFLKREKKKKKASQVIGQKVWISVLCTSCSCFFLVVPIYNFCDFSLATYSCRNNSYFHHGSHYHLCPWKIPLLPSLALCPIDFLSSSLLDYHPLTPPHREVGGKGGNVTLDGYCIHNGKQKVNSLTSVWKHFSTLCTGPGTRSLHSSLTISFMYPPSSCAWKRQKQIKKKDWYNVTGLQLVVISLFVQYSTSPKQGDFVPRFNPLPFHITCFYRQGNPSL